MFPPISQRNCVKLCITLWFIASYWLKRLFRDKFDFVIWYFKFLKIIYGLPLEGFFTEVKSYIHWSHHVSASAKSLSQDCYKIQKVKRLTSKSGEKWVKFWGKNRWCDFLQFNNQLGMVSLTAARAKYS